MGEGGRRQMDTARKRASGDGRAPQTGLPRRGATRARPRRQGGSRGRRRAAAASADRGGGADGGSHGGGRRRSGRGGEAAIGGGGATRDSGRARRMYCMCAALVDAAKVQQEDAVKVWASTQFC